MIICLAGMICGMAITILLAMCANSGAMSRKEEEENTYEKNSEI